MVVGSGRHTEDWHPFDHCRPTFEPGDRPDCRQASEVADKLLLHRLSTALPVHRKHLVGFAHCVVPRDQPAERLHRGYQVTPSGKASLIYRTPMSGGRLGAGMRKRNTRCPSSVRRESMWLKAGTA